MLKLAQFKIAFDVDWVTFSEVPAVAAVAAPYCTNDCAEEPQFVARHLTGKGAEEGGDAVAAPAHRLRRAQRPYEARLVKRRLEFPAIVLGAPW